MSIITRAISDLCFPIGALTKPEVREIATEMELITAEKKDSQGLCFIGKVRLPEFYSKNCNKEGLIIQIDKMIRFTILKSPQIYQLKKS
jgi:tRNA-specific 2-thiouridylase